MCLSLEEAAEVIHREARDLRAEALSTSDAARRFRLFVRLEKACASARAALAAAVDDSGAWRRDGAYSAEEWAARAAGTSISEASKMLETARRLRKLPATERAFRAGDLSAAQAAAVAKGAEAEPSAEAELLEAARSQPLRALETRAREVVLAKVDRDELYSRQRSLRAFTHGTDDEGMVWGRFRLPPDTGARIVNAVEREADRHYRAAYRQGRRESHAAYAADALVALVLGTASPAGKGAEVVVHVSREALLRGSVVDGEICVIPGFGPVPASVARDVLADAFLKGVVVDGRRVVTIRHFGRHRPTELDTALAVRSVLDTGDVVCDAPWCDSRMGIEWDHTQDFARGGVTAEDNLRPLCRRCHRDKTAGRIRLENGGWVRVADRDDGDEERGPP